MEETGNKINKLLKNISLNSINGLDIEFKKVIDIFQENNIEVYIPEILNNTIISKDFCRIFNVYEHDTKDKHSIFVCYGYLNDEKISLLLNSFSKYDNKNSIYFISDYPLPNILKFFNKNKLNSFLEYECLKNSKNINDIIDNTELIEKYSDKFIDIFKIFFNEQLDYKNIYPSLKIFENTLIKNLRECHEYDYLLDTDFDYFPKYILELAGIYITKLIKNNFDSDIYFPNDSKNMEDLLLHLHGKKEEIYIFPVRKLSEFFYGGKNDSIINWYYEIKYQYNLS